MRLDSAQWLNCMRIVACLALCLACGEVLASAKLEHRVVARIAWEHMKAEARAQAIQLLTRVPADAGWQGSQAQDPTSLLATFMNASNWADEVRISDRSRKYSCPMWHYAEFAIAEEGVAIPDIPRFRPSGANVVEQIRSFEGTLKDANEPAQARAIALLWLVHLVGDIHQPVHLVSRVTKEDPQGDMGKNRFRLQEESLHAYWDTFLTRQFRDMPEDLVFRRLVAEHPRERLLELVAVMQAERWAEESIALARSAVYDADLIRGQAPSGGYEARAFAIGRRQTALAGYRLAEMLNAALGERRSGLAEPSAAQVLESRVKYEFACAQSNLASRVRTLNFVTGRRVPGPGGDGQLVEGFDPATVRGILAQARNDLVASLTGDELDAFKHYVEAKFPDASGLELIRVGARSVTRITQNSTLLPIGYVSRPEKTAQPSETTLASVPSTNKTFSDAFRFSKDAKAHIGQVDISIKTVPEAGATITLKTQTGRTLPRETNSTLKLWRGMYAIEVRKDGFERIDLPYQEVGFGTDSIECFLVPLGSTPRSCNIR